MLSGLKSCLEVHKYMYNDGQTIPTRPPMLPNSSLDDNPRIESDVMVESTSFSFSIFLVVSWR